MTDKRTSEGDLMKDGILAWSVFMPDGKTALYLDGNVHLENGRLAYGKLLSPDMPVFHELCTPDDIFMFLIFRNGVSKRVKMRLRYTGAEDNTAERPGYEPEICFPAWIVPGKTGRISLYLQEPSTGICTIPDMTGLPGLPGLQPDGIPVKLEMLIRQANPLFDSPEYSEMIYPKTNRKSDLMKEGVLVWIMFAQDGKAALYMNERIHFVENEKYVPGKLLSPDISSFHEVYDWDEQYSRICSSPGSTVRYRIRLRLPGADDVGIEQSEHEPEACFVGWIVPKQTGQVSLYLQMPSAGQCFIPDIAGLPGLPELQPDGIPVRVEMLIRQAHWLFDMVNPAFLKISNLSKDGEAIWGCKVEHP